MAQECTTQHMQYENFYKKTPKISPIKLHSRLATDNGWGKAICIPKPEDIQNHHITLQFNSTLILCNRAIKAIYSYLNTIWDLNLPSLVLDAIRNNVTIF